MESFEQLRESFCIPEIQKKNYWFVRTEGGTYFDDFYQNGYIAIDWEYLTPEVMSKDMDGNIDEISIKKIIAQKENRLLELTITEEDFQSLSPDNQKLEKAKLKSDKSHVTAIYNKIYRFLYELSIGDIVVVPSYNSDYIAIGTIKSDVFIDTEYTSEFEKRLDMPEYAPCPYAKRRGVEWHVKIAHTDLEIFLQNALRPQQAITSLNEYAPYINRNIYSLYTEGDIIHSVFKTFQDGDLTLSQLSDFTNALMRQIEIVNETLEVPLSSDEIKIKVNVHSPGLIEIIGAGIGAGLAVVGFIGAYICNKYGGKVSLKVCGNEATFETQGKEEIKLENRKIDLEERKLALQEKKIDVVERCLDSPDYVQKLNALSSLNLQVPPIYALENAEDDTENIKAE